MRDINGPMTINNLCFKGVKDAQANNYDLRFLSCLLSLTAVGEVFSLSREMPKRESQVAARDERRLYLQLG